MDGQREERGGERGKGREAEEGERGTQTIMYLILCWNLHTVFSQCRVYSEHIANTGPFPLLEGLALSQLPGILSKSLQVVALRREHLGRGWEKWGGRGGREKGEEEGEGKGNGMIVEEMRGTAPHSSTRYYGR